jgi:hypothetical protein
MTMRMTRLVVAAAAAWLVVSCSPKPRPSVVGKWLTPTGGSIEFKADGRATMAGPLGSREVRYRLPDGRTIEISRPGGGATVRWRVVSLGAQELVVQDADGVETRLRRGE